MVVAWLLCLYRCRRPTLFSQEDHWGRAIALQVRGSLSQKTTLMLLFYYLRIPNSVHYLLLGLVGNSSCTSSTMNTMIACMTHGSKISIRLQAHQLSNRRAALFGGGRDTSEVERGCPRLATTGFQRAIYRRCPIFFIVLGTPTVALGALKRSGCVSGERLLHIPVTRTPGDEKAAVWLHGCNKHKAASRHRRQPVQKMLIFFHDHYCCRLFVPGRLEAEREAIPDWAVAWRSIASSIFSLSTELESSSMQAIDSRRQAEPGCPAGSIARASPAPSTSKALLLALP
jgi:hypothetical protein